MGYFRNEKIISFCLIDDFRAHQFYYWKINMMNIENISYYWESKILNFLTQMWIRHTSRDFGASHIQPDIVTQIRCLQMNGLAVVHEMWLSDLHNIAKLKHWVEDIWRNIKPNVYRIYAGGLLGQPLFPSSDCVYLHSKHPTLFSDMTYFATVLLVYIAPKYPLQT